MASRPARPKPLDWAAPSHLIVFIRNLKLLQLDKRDDWPNITLRALSPSSQNQRQRIRLVEWALYYLFTIWDPEHAQNVRETNESMLREKFADRDIETTPVLPTARTPAVCQPPRRPVSLSRRIEKEWRPGSGDNSPQNNVG